MKRGLVLEALAERRHLEQLLCHDSLAALLNVLRQRGLLTILPCGQVMLDIFVEDPGSGVLQRRLMQALQAFGLGSVLVEQFLAYAGGDACSYGCLAHPFFLEQGVGREFVISGWLLIELIC